MQWNAGLWVRHCRADIRLVSGSGTGSGYESDNAIGYATGLTVQGAVAVQTQILTNNNSGACRIIRKRRNVVLTGIRA